MSRLLLVDGKVCTRCQMKKPESEFHRSAQGKNGRQSRCKLCTNDLRREYRHSTPQRLERHRELDRLNYLKHKDRFKAYNLLKLYGLTFEKYQEMLSKQAGLCGLCGKKPRGKRPMLFIDHDHETGKIRKLLCQTCNQGLGQFRDDPALLRAAAMYVEEFR